MLNLFRWGPMHDQIHTTEALLQDRSIARWIAEYDWTKEKVVGSVSGREARVWVHKEHTA